jgi:UDPglucose 6-dehydrogenase
MKVGIIGYGFVGGAVKNAYDTVGIECLVSDPTKGFIVDNNELFKCDGIFVCVPSPMGSNGECDTSILESVINNLRDYKGTIISKVTANPMTYLELQKKCINLIHAPEFLVAATAKEDYINGEFAVIGGDLEYCKKALYIIKLAQNKIRNYKFCSIQEAALTKYTINSLLATKVMFLNQLKQVSDKIGADYNIIAQCITMDTRIGSSHVSVPGPDGLYGFGGACFPKDTSALCHLSDSVDIDFTILKEVIRSNKKIRNDL